MVEPVHSATARPSRLSERLAERSPDRSAALPAHAIGRARLLAPHEAWILALAALPRLIIAYTDHGMVWGDEIFQSLEPAHKIAFGYGSLAWEFRDGARSWLFPGLLAGVMKLGAFMGAHTGLAVVGVAKTSMVLLGLLGLLATMRLAEWLGGKPAALLAGALAASFPTALVFGSRAMSETASGALLALAAWLLVKEGGARATWAGAIAAAAIFFRYQNGLVAVALLALPLAQRRRWPDALRYAVAATVIGLAGGALDWFTWGRPFHSFRVYWDYNFVRDQAAHWGTSPWSFYFQVAWSSTGPLILVVALGLLLAARRAPTLLAVVALYVAAHCAIGHKEFRFLMPILPLALALAGVGLGRAMTYLTQGPWIPSATAALLSIAFLFRAHAMIFDDLGLLREAPRDSLRSPWGYYGGVNESLAEAGTREDVCGVAVIGVPPWWIGGYSYLHRDVPLFAESTRAPRPGVIPASNYLVIESTTPRPAGYAPISTHGEYTLLQRRGGCLSPPTWYRRPLE